MANCFCKCTDASLLRFGDRYNYGGAHYYGKAVEIAEELGHEPKTVREAG